MRLQETPSFGIVRVSFGQGPYGVKVIRQQAQVTSSNGCRVRLSFHACLRHFRANGSVREERRSRVTTVKKNVPPSLRSRMYSGISPPLQTTNARRNIVRRDGGLRFASLHSTDPTFSVVAQRPRPERRRRGRGSAWDAWRRWPGAVRRYCRRDGSA